MRSVPSWPMRRSVCRSSDCSRCPGSCAMSGETDSPGVDAERRVVGDGYQLAVRTVRSAGFNPESFVTKYWACKLLLAVLVPGLMLAAGWSIKASSLIATGIGASFGVELWLWLRMRSRQRRIAQALSYFVDMITAFLRAGMSLDAAI